MNAAKTLDYFCGFRPVRILNLHTTLALPHLTGLLEYVQLPFCICTFRYYVSFYQRAQAVVKASTIYYYYVQLKVVYYFLVLTETD